MRGKARSPVTTTRSVWLRTIEQIALACFREHRVVGFAAPHPAAGVSTISHAFAELSASWGVKTLLLDLSTAGSNVEMTRPWAPGIGSPKDYLEQSDYGYDTIQVVPGQGPAIGYNNPRDLLASLFNELVEYRTIILDLPALLDYSDYTISPIIGALSCDMVVMVCSKGATTNDQLKKSIEILEVAGAKLGGTVLNEFDPSESKPRFRPNERGPKRLTIKRNVAHLEEKN